MPAGRRHQLEHGAAVPAEHDAGDEQHLPREQRERVLELRGEHAGRRHRVEGVEPPAHGEHDERQAAAQRREQQRRHDEQHDVQPHDVELPRAELEQEQVADDEARHRVVAQALDVGVGVGDLAAAVERRDRAAVHARDEREEVHEQDDGEGSPVELPRSRQQRTGHRDEVGALEALPVDHADDEARHRDEELGARDDPDRLLRGQLEQRRQLEVVHDDEDDRDTAQQVDAQVALGGVRVVPGGPAQQAVQQQPDTDQGDGGGCGSTRQGRAGRWRRAVHRRLRRPAGRQRWRRGARGR